MANTAQIVNFPSMQEAPTHEPGAYVKADIDNGYDRFAQQLTNTLANPPIKLSAREYQLIFAVVSKTYRWQKKTDWISNSQLSEMTGIDITNIGKLIKGLIAKCVLIRNGKETGINPVVSQWCESKTSQKRLNTSQNQLVKNDYKTSQKRLTNSSKTTKKLVKTDPHKRKETTTKETTTKDKAQALDYSCWPAMPSEQTLKDWLTMRKRLKANVTQTVINRLSKQLHLAVQNGLTVDDCLAECVVRNWRGFEYAWVARVQNQGYTQSQRRPANVMQELQQLSEQMGSVPMLADDQEV